MSERYIKLYSLPERLYAESSPLMIAAGNLLKDNQSGNVLAQLKLKNLGEWPIKAAKVRLFPLDTAKKPLGDSLVYEYLDLNAGRDAEFGQKTPFPLPNASTRAILAEVIEVAFADYSVWTECGALWEPLPPAEPLEKALGDRELAKQYRLRFGEQAVKGPARHRDLWLCSCGALNRAEEESCHACRRSRDEQLDCDLSALAAARDARLAAEKAAREKAAAEAAEQARIEAERAAALAKEKAERAAEAKVKRKKVGKIVGLAMIPLLIAAAILLGIPGLSDIQAGKAADAGDYIGAVEKYRSAADWGLFNALFHPGDKAEALVPAARYQEGEEALAEGRYADALAAFEAAGDYRNAPERMLDTHYQEGEAALAEGRYEDALAAFEAAGDYKDATERRTECLAGAIEAYGEAGDLEKAEELLKDVPAGERERLAFSLAEKAVEQGEYRRAYEFFREAGSKPEDAEVWAECCAAAVREYAAEGDMEAAEIARKAYTLRGRNNKGTELNLVLAEGYIRAGDYGKAKSFLPGGVFQDADLEARRQEARYQLGLGLYEQGSFENAMSYLDGSYKDSEHYYALCLVGKTTEKADKGDYARAVSVAGKVDESKLTKEEREAFHDALYSAAAQAKNNGDYANAFALYRLSQTKDYQTQMDLCNEKYITTPRSILRSEGLGTTGVSIHRDLGSYGELTDVRCTYSKGQLTFTLYYTANRDLEWVLFRGPYNDNHFRSFTRGTVKKGSGSTSFTVSYSALRSYNETWIELYTNGGSGFDMVTLYSSDFEAWTLDLYGNPIP